MKKWLPVIGYTVLAVVVYYIIDVLLSMVWLVGFVRILKRTILSIYPICQYYTKSSDASCIWILVQKEDGQIKICQKGGKENFCKKRHLSAGDRTVWTICDVVSADVDLSGVSRRFCAI